MRRSRRGSAPSGDRRRPGTDFAECHRHGVVEQHAVDEPVADAGDQLDRFRRLDGADDAGQGREDSDVFGFFDGTRGRRLRIEAAVATAARDEHGHLALDAEDAAVDQGLAEHIGGVAEQVAGAKRIGAVDDDLVAIEQLHRVAFIHGRLDRLHLDVGIQCADRAGRAVDF